MDDVEKKVIVKMQKIAVLLDNPVNPGLQLLYEDHMMLNASDG